MGRTKNTTIGIRSVTKKKLDKHRAKGETWDLFLARVAKELDTSPEHG